jgi:hypothetical protein
MLVLWLMWGLKQNCSPYRKISNGMGHATCTKGNWGDSRLLVVGSQIVSLTFNPSFGHSLWFKYPNGSCEPILNIYIPRTFQWYNFFSSIQWVLIPPIILWRFGNPLSFWLPKWKLIWECEGSFPHTLLHSWEHEMWLLGSLLACIFASLCLGCKPKVRVATTSPHSLNKWIHYFPLGFIHYNEWIT